MKRFVFCVLILVMCMMPLEVWAESNISEQNIGSSTDEEIVADRTSAEENIKAKINAYVSSLGGQCSASYQGKASGCAAFCNYVWSNVFGFDWYASGNHTKINKSWSSTSELISSLNSSARPGDVIWGKGGHNMIIMGWSSSGITISDSTSAGKVWHNNEFVSFSGSEWKNYYAGYFSAGYRIYHINDSIYYSYETSTDNVMPTIQNVKIVARYKNGFTMECTVTDNVGVSKVQFPTWESSKTSAGCTWYNGTNMGNNKWRFTFPNATTEGYYTTHIYAWDAAGNSASAGIDTYVDQTPPTISNISVVEANADGYKVRCTVTDNYEVDRVQFPTWTSNNGQDDIQLNWTTDIGARGENCGNNIYEYYVKRSDHNGEFGNYETHVYAYDTWGNYTCVGTGLINLENVPPTFSDVAIINQTDEGYTVTCKATDESGIGKIDVCVWTEENGQDDIVVGNGKHTGNDVYSYYVKYSNHNNEYGKYITHIYAYDTLGNQVFCGGFSIQHKESLGEVDDESSTPTTPTTPTVSRTPNVSDQLDEVDGPPAVGTVVSYGGLKYKVIKNGKGCYMQCIGPESKDITKATIENYISVGEYKYPVCQIKSNAFKNCKKLKKLVIGDNIKTIGKKAFYGCKKLQSITIQGKKLAVVKTNAFKGIHKKARIKVPKSKLSKYKKLLKKAGVKSTATFKY